MKITGCIFDMDGTLLDSMPLWAISGHEYLISEGKTPKNDLEEQMRTMSMPQITVYFREEYGVDKSLEEIHQGLNKVLENQYKTAAFPKADVMEFLEKMALQGVKMCVASATDKYLVKEALRANSMDKYFSAVFSCTDVGKGKDHPDIYNLALKHLGTEKSSTYIFEDAYYAVKTAKKHGFNVVGVYDKSSCDQWDSIRKSSDLYIENSYRELDNIL